MNSYEDETQTGTDGGNADDGIVKRRDAARKKDSRKDRKDKGYVIFEEEDSEEELVADDAIKSPTKVKKHTKPFKFTKKDKPAKIKDKDKEKEKDKKERWEKEKKEADREKMKVEKIEKKDKFGKEKKDKDHKKDEDLKSKSKKKFMSVVKEDDTGEEQKPVFGVALQMAVDRSPCHDGIQLPVVVRECIDYVEEFGLTCEGIYRISGVKSKVQTLKDAYNRSHPAYLHEYEPNVIASLLKQFFRDLPEPVLTARLMPKFEQASTIKNVKEKVEQFELLLRDLPLANRVLLSWMIVHMTHVIAREKQNKMTLQNVSIVLSPTMQISHRVLNIFFAYSKILFKDTVIKRAERANITWLQSLPGTNTFDEVLASQPGIAIQRCWTDPSGFTKSTLYRSEMTLSTRGSYRCIDKSSSYTIAVTVLYIYARVIENKADRLVLNCSISGFDTNLPTMDYDWTLNDALIPHAHEHAVAAASMRSAAELASSSKFFVRLDGTELSLTVNNPTKADAGIYNCSFTLGTEHGRKTFTESINVLGSSLPSVASDLVLPSCFLLLIFPLVTCLLSNAC